MSNISIHKGDLILTFKTWQFPDGARGVRLDTNNLKYFYEPKPYTVVARIQSATDILDLLMVKDALDRWDKRPVHLFMPFVPYARQDRPCVKGEAFSLKVFGRLINSAGFERVTVVDPHSDVTAAVMDNLTVISQMDVINKFEAFTKRLLPNGPPLLFRFVSPDAGANKKTAVLASYFAHDDFIRADKKRNLATGDILETIVYADKLDGTTAVIADDICDGGASFIGLAKALKAKGADKVILYVTHGIFSKGTKPLYDAGIDEIFSTNSFYEVWPAGVDGVTTLKLEEVLKI